jgi:uncharacterized protein (TIGR02145 family)
MKAIQLSVTCLILFGSCQKHDNDSDNTIKDIEGNIYHTVTIGTQVWMVENLKTTKYRNGDLIGTTTPSTLDIYGESTPKYQWAYEGKESNVVTYGRLYTCYVVTDSRNVCPVGWHIPSDAEWTELTDYLGGDSIAGGKLKEVGLTHWLSPNEGASNSSGFTALPCGFRYPDGAFHSIGDYGIWWSATEGGGANAWDRYIYYGCACVGRYDDVREAGFSVRLVRDN